MIRNLLRTWLRPVPIVGEAGAGGFFGRARLAGLDVEAGYRGEYPDLLGDGERLVSGEDVFPALMAVPGQGEDKVTADLTETERQHLLNMLATIRRTASEMLGGPAGHGSEAVT
jgi:hypothetical protein